MCHFYYLIVKIAHKQATYQSAQNVFNLIIF
jgi:hypothetical protein